MKHELMYEEEMDVADIKPAKRGKGERSVAKEMTITDLPGVGAATAEKMASAGYDTLLSIGPNSELVVDEFAYSPGRSELTLLVRLSKGTLHYISGVIAKLRPEGVAVKTPTGLIGVRGTEFLLRVDPWDVQ